MVIEPEKGRNKGPPGATAGLPSSADLRQLDKSKGTGLIVSHQRVLPPDPPYIGALPPGPALPEGDWFTRLQERWTNQRGQDLLFHMICPHQRVLTRMALNRRNTRCVNR